MPSGFELTRHGSELPVVHVQREDERNGSDQLDNKLRFLEGGHYIILFPANATPQPSQPNRVVSYSLRTARGLRSGWRRALDERLSPGPFLGTSCSSRLFSQFTGVYGEIFSHLKIHPINLGEIAPR